MLKMNDLLTPDRTLVSPQGPSYTKVWNLFRPRGRVVKIDLTPGGILLKGKEKKVGTPIWIYYRGIYSGKIVDGRATIYPPNPEHKIIRDTLDELERDPLAMVMKYGLQSGQCCICSRTLTDEVSVREGIGPICKKFF